jgi:hypothetical protein
MYLRFTISAAFSTLALTLLPFFLVGMLLRCVFAPIQSVYERWSAPKHQRRRPRKAAISQAPAAAAVSAPEAKTKTSDRLPTIVMPLQHTPAQIFADSTRRATPPSPMSSMSTASTLSRNGSRTPSI